MPRQSQLGVGSVIIRTRSRTEPDDMKEGVKATKGEFEGEGGEDRSRFWRGVRGPEQQGYEPQAQRAQSAEHS